jgi:FMN phosphatase YigB (HAD superfamily)
MDMDGTLYLKRDVHAVTAMMAERLYAYTDRAGIPRRGVSALVNRHIRELRIPFLIYLLSKKYGLDTTDFVEYAFNIHPRAFGIKRDARLVSLLTKLGRTNEIILFTNSPLIWASRVVKALGLDKVIPGRNMICFENLDCGRSSKPSEKAYMILLKRTGNDPEALLLLEDNYKNARVARGLGIRTIHIHNRPDRKAGRKDIYAVLEELLEVGRDSFRGND